MRSLLMMAVRHTISDGVMKMFDPHKLTTLERTIVTVILTAPVVILVIVLAAEATR